MDANEFWCRSFWAAMGETYRELLPGTSRENHDWAAAYCERAADAALAVAQRRGMVTGERAARAPVAEPELERVEFTAERGSEGRWTLFTVAFPDGLTAIEGDETIVLLDGRTMRIKWGETMPPRPIEVWLERR